jgi:hypothetical protein
MKKFLQLTAACAMVAMAACSGEQKPAEQKLSTEEEKAVEERMQKDRQAMDSLEKAIMDQIDQDTTSIPM